MGRCGGHLSLSWSRRGPSWDFPEAPRRPRGNPERAPRRLLGSTFCMHQLTLYCFRVLRSGSRVGSSSMLHALPFAPQRGVVLIINVPRHAIAIASCNVHLDLGPSWGRLGALSEPSRGPLKSFSKPPRGLGRASPSTLEGNGELGSPTASINHLANLARS